MNIKKPKIRVYRSPISNKEETGHQPGYSIDLMTGVTELKKVYQNSALVYDTAIEFKETPGICPRIYIGEPLPVMEVLFGKIKDHHVKRAKRKMRRRALRVAKGLVMHLEPELDNQTNQD